MASEIPETVEHVDMAGILMVLADYQLQRDIKERRQMVLAQENINSLNELLDLGFANKFALAESGMLAPMQKIVSSLLETTVESINTHNEDAANLLNAVRAVEFKIVEALKAHE
jgi:hypothetical protein